MRRLLAVLGCGLVVGCGIKLGEYPRPYACDRNGGDGGVQCNTGWACGFDDRCFEKNLVLDGGQFVEEWRCSMPSHCPNRWQCGQEVDSVRNCQQIDAGAPSHCATDEGCQGGWRCAASRRCFDPSDTDGGTTRACTADAQCPNAFLCGELVPGKPRLCVQEGVGADSWCVTDQGCQASRRCDTFAQKCVVVLDAITTGQTSTLGAQVLNPRVVEPAPLMMAMTRMGRVPSAFGGSSEPGLNPGLLMASLLANGSLRVVAQLRDNRRTDAGVTLLFQNVYGVPGAAADVTDLALSVEGPAVRFRDGGASRLSLFDGGWRPLGATDFLRQLDPLEGEQGLTQLVRVSGSQVWIDGLDAGLDAGLTFGGPVREVVATRDTFVVLTGNGVFVPALDGGAPVQVIDAGVSVFSRGAVAGFPGPVLNPNPPLGIVAELPLPGGMTGIVGVVAGPMGWAVSPFVAACPDGTSPLQLAFDQDMGGGPMAIARCATNAGPSYPVQVGLTTSSPTYEALIEDQVPYQWGVVPQRSAPFVRAHAATNGRLWHAMDPTSRALLGRLPLRPLLLDRQPDTMISFFEGSTIRVFAEAAGFTFTNDSNGGFVSQLRQDPSVPLSVVPGNLSWIITTTGAIVTGIDKSRQMATTPAGVRFVAPASGAATVIQLGARLRKVLIVASEDAIWVADVTDAATGGPFAQPAVFERVLVPVSGVRLRSMTLAPAPGGGLSGYLTTSTQNLSFSTTDLVRWQLTAVSTPMMDALPLEVWAERDGGAGRTGFSDGRVWSLPIMVPLTDPLPARDGGALTASDYGRKCGDLFVATAEGLFRAQSPGPDAGLPRWVSVPSVNARLDSTESLRLYETHDEDDRLFVGTQSGQVLELTSPTSCPGN